MCCKVKNFVGVALERKVNAHVAELLDTVVSVRQICLVAHLLVNLLSDAIADDLKQSSIFRCPQEGGGSLR